MSIERMKLFIKFENDIEKRTRLKRFLLSLDQMGNVIFLNGSQDETISSHIARKMEDKRATKIEILVCKLLRKAESKHCIKSLGE